MKIKNSHEFSWAQFGVLWGVGGQIGEEFGENLLELLLEVSKAD
jgi:hypothetical protein